MNRKRVLRPSLSKYDKNVCYKYYLKFLSTFISRLYGTNSSFVIQTNLQYDENRSPDDSINKFETLCLSRRQWTMHNTIVVLLFLLHYIPSGGISQNALPAYMSGFSKRCGSKGGQRCPCPLCKKNPSLFILCRSERDYALFT